MAKVFDLSKFASARARGLPDPELTPRLTKRSRAEYRFIRIPALWREKLASDSHASTLKLALHLLVRDWENHDAPIRLSNGRLAKAGVSHDQKWRALAELESLGLVFVERRARKSPIVALVKSGDSST